MSRKYFIATQEYPYFVTFTVIHWIDAFIRQEYREIFFDSVRYCQQNKGLQVHAWCMMTSHVHLILSTQGKNKPEHIIRDLKSFTSRHIRKLLEDRTWTKESRREWMYWMMQRAGRKNRNNNDFQFWQQHNHPIELSSHKITNQRLQYIHNNPVEAGFVETAEAWPLSSAGDYAETRKGMLELRFID